MFELIEPDEALLNAVLAAKAQKSAQIDIGRNVGVKFLEDLRKIDQSQLNNKMRKRLAILLEELEKAAATIAVGEKHPAMQELEKELQDKSFSSEAELREITGIMYIEIG